MQFNISNDEQCCLHVNIFLRNLSLFHRRGPGSEACVCVCHVLHLQHAPRLLLLEHWDLVETCGNVHINKHDYEFGVTQFTRWLLTCVFVTNSSLETKHSWRFLHFSRWKIFVVMWRQHHDFKTRDHKTVSWVQRVCCCTCGVKMWRRTALNLGCEVFSRQTNKGQRLCSPYEACF